VKRLTVHHVIPVHVDPSLELDEKNLITLCGVCHFVFGHFFSWRKFNESVREDVEHFRQKLETHHEKMLGRAVSRDESKTEGVD
jgi:hypothetical protein